MLNSICEECGKGTVQPLKIKNFSTKVRGLPFVVPEAVVRVCDACGARVFDPKEIRRWIRLYDQMAEQRGGIFSANEIRQIRAQLQLSIGSFANLLGCTRQSVYNWEREDRRSPQLRIADLLLRLIRESMAHGPVEVVPFLQEQARAMGVEISTKASKPKGKYLKNWGTALELPPCSEFDQLFGIHEEPVDLPQLTL